MVTIPPHYEEIFEELSSFDVTDRESKRDHLNNYTEFIGLPNLKKAYHDRKWYNVKEVVYYIFELANAIEYDASDDKQNELLNTIQQQDPTWTFCVCCKYNQAIVQDSRDLDNTGYDKYSVCGSCGQLTNADFIKLKNSTKYN